MLEERWNLVDMAFRSCIHALSNAWGKQLIIGNGKGFLSKAQQVVGGFTSTVDDDLHGVTQAAQCIHYLYCIITNEGWILHSDFLVDHIMV